MRSLFTFYTQFLIEKYVFTILKSFKSKQHKILNNKSSRCSRLHFVNNVHIRSKISLNILIDNGIPRLGFILSITGFNNFTFIGDSVEDKIVLVS